MRKASAINSWNLVQRLVRFEQHSRHLNSIPPTNLVFNVWLFNLDTMLVNFWQISLSNHQKFINIDLKLSASYCFEGFDGGYELVN